MFGNRYALYFQRNVITEDTHSSLVHERALLLQITHPKGSAMDWNGVNISIPLFLRSIILLQRNDLKKLGLSSGN